MPLFFSFSFLFRIYFPNYFYRSFLFNALFFAYLATLLFFLFFLSLYLFLFFSSALSCLSLLFFVFSIHPSFFLFTSAVGTRMSPSHSLWNSCSDFHKKFSSHCKIILNRSIQSVWSIFFFKSVLLICPTTTFSTFLFAGDTSNKQFKHDYVPCHLPF